MFADYSHSPVPSIFMSAFWRRNLVKCIDIGFSQRVKYQTFIGVNLSNVMSNAL